MSKTALKKELQTLSHDQLTQIILDAYDAKSDFKDYFEFFLNPDVNRLIEKFEKVITKELARVKWGYSKARVTVFKKAIKDFSGFNPGPEHVLKLMFRVLNLMGLVERYTNFSKSQLNYVENLSHQIMQYAEKHEMVAAAIERLKEECASNAYTVYYRQHITRGASRAD